MIRRLTSGEIALGQSMFGEAIDYGRVRVAAGAFGAYAVVLGPVMTFPRGSPSDFSVTGLTERAWFIHELTHVWQFQTAPLRTLTSWAKTAASGGYGPGLPGYRYELPLQRFDAYGLEQQASMVEHAYLLRHGRRPEAAPRGVTLAHYERRLPFAGSGDGVVLTA